MRLVGWIRLRLLAACCVVACASPVFAQIAPGEITGVVKDPDQAVVIGAPVTVTNQATQARITTVTSRTGRYTFSALLPGRYVVEARAEGFTAAVSPALESRPARR